jgi:rhodanese-related sulfurtransferase
VVAFCDHGDESARVVAFFRARGMEDTWWMAGGLQAWRDTGGPVAP